MTAQAGAILNTVSAWDAVDWRNIERNIGRLQARIVKAVQQKKWNKVRALQHLLTHSAGGKLLAIRRVTENDGRKTPGVDGELWDTPQKKLQGMTSLKIRGYHPMPLRRIYIPKANGKLRPLGIPTMRDRAMQALYLLALDPVAETLADGFSYGFRRGRSCADALEQCFKTLCHQNPRWVVEGDIKGCFDNLSHQWLLDDVPLSKPILRKWLKSGYLEKQVFFDTISGTPQGGIISPVLANLALDGLERRLRESFPLRGKGSERGRAAQVHLVRYADDFVITGHSEELLKMTVKPLVESFLLERGLVLSPEKTVITHVRDGFDFLGQNVRRYPNGKLLIKPSRKSIETLLSKVKQIIREHIGRAAHVLINRLNPVIRGWAIRRGNRVVCAIGSRGCRCGPSASTCARARRTKVQELQTGHSSHRSRVFRRMRMTLPNTLLACNRLRYLVFRYLLRDPTAFSIADGIFIYGCAHLTNHPHRRRSNDSKSTEFFLYRA